MLEFCQHRNAMLEFCQHRFEMPCWSFANILRRGGWRGRDCRPPAGWGWLRRSLSFVPLHFFIVWNHEQGLYKPSTSIPPPTSNGARAQSAVVSQGAAAPSPSSALPPPQLHAPQAPAAAAASARAAPGASIFDGVPFHPRRPGGSPHPQLHLRIP